MSKAWDNLVQGLKDAFASIGTTLGEWLPRICQPGGLGFHPSRCPPHDRIPKLRMCRVVLSEPDPSGGLTI